MGGRCTTSARSVGVGVGGQAAGAPHQKPPPLQTLESTEYGHRTRDWLVKSTGSISTAAPIS